MEQLSKRLITSLTLEQLMDYRRRQELSFFQQDDYEEKAREWLLHFLKEIDPAKLTDNQLNFIIYDVFKFTCGLAAIIVNDYEHDTWRDTMIFLLRAIKHGVYPW